MMMVMTICSATEPSERGEESGNADEKPGVGGPRGNLRSSPTEKGGEGEKDRERESKLLLFPSNELPRDEGVERGKERK